MYEEIFSKETRAKLAKLERWRKSPLKLSDRSDAVKVKRICGRIGLYLSWLLVITMVAITVINIVVLIQSMRVTSETNNNEMVSTNVSKASNASTPLPSLPAKDVRFLTNAELKAKVGHHLPSLPIAYWQSDKHFWIKNKTCAPFPSFEDIIFDNTYWQMLRSSNGTFFLYNAYLDVRKAMKHGPSVRILGVYDRIKPTLITHCQLWFKNRKNAVVVRNSQYMYIWIKEWGFYRNHLLQPYLMRCELPKNMRHLIPVSVSLVEHMCDRATNNLRVLYDPPLSKMKNFAVCVKYLNFPQKDISVRLIEWIELVNLMGADQIFFYDLQVHPNITKVLDYYSARGMVTVTPFTLPGSQLLNVPRLKPMYLKKGIVTRRQIELISYNDCLYRNLYKYRWVVLLDVDEIILPVRDSNWTALMDRVLPQSQFPSRFDMLLRRKRRKTPRSSFIVLHTYFLDSLRPHFQTEVPRYMHILQHVYRTHNYTKPGSYIKAFHETSQVLSLHNHFPLACLGGYCSSYWLRTDYARLYHYREDCVAYMPSECKLLRAQVDKDTLIWQWRNPLIERVNGALRSLRFFSVLR